MCVCVCVCQRYVLPYTTKASLGSSCAADKEAEGFIDLSKEDRFLKACKLFPVIPNVYMQMNAAQAQHLG